jgi:hypothetical protein
MVWKRIQVHDVMQQAGFCAVGRGKFSWQDLTFQPSFRQPTNKRPKPLPPNHHNWSWYIQWMILDGLEVHTHTVKFSYFSHVQPLPIRHHTAAKRHPSTATPIPPNPSNNSPSYVDSCGGFVF